jgi:hypothetical protein
MELAIAIEAVLRLIMIGCLDAVDVVIILEIEFRGQKLDYSFFAFTFFILVVIIKASMNRIALDA